MQGIGYLGRGVRTLNRSSCWLIEQGQVVVGEEVALVVVVGDPSFGCADAVEGAGEVFDCAGNADDADLFGFEAFDVPEDFRRRRRLSAWHRTQSCSLCVEQ